MKYNEFKQNELEVRNYDKVIGYAGRCRKPMIDWVTEYTFISVKSLTKNEFIEIIGGVSGQVQFIKKLLTFGNGKKLYKHICKAVMY